VRAALGGLRAAVGLLTIVPAGRGAPGDGALRAAPGWFVVVGALLGATAAGAWVLAEPLLGGAYASALALTVTAALTGALHHDGLADTADGLGVRGGASLRLAVMRESQIGAYGALALIAWALLALSALARLTPSEAASALVCGHALGRWATLPQLARLTPAREDGLGAAFSAGPVGVLGGSACAAVIALAVAGPVAGAAALGAALVGSGATALLAQRSVGGRTGDTLGATVLVTELLVYSVLAAI